MNPTRALYSRSFAIAAVLAIATLVPPMSLERRSVAGGLEFACDHTTEHWASIPSGGIPWYMGRTTVATFQQVCPGYPGFQCSFTGNAKQRPGVQSARGAANAWSHAMIPLNIPLAPLPGGGTNKDATAFRFTDGPVGYKLVPASGTLVNAGSPAADGLNVVTMLEPSQTFASAGGIAALAIAVVAFAPGSTNLIGEADIAVNTSTVTVVGRSWAWVEDNAVTGVNHVSLDVTSTQSNVFGYADLQGVLTHEFGHAAGLGHSLVDSEYNDAIDHIPTMFGWAHSHPYNATVVYTNSSCAGSPPRAASGFLFARESRSLENDDVSAIGAGYPAGPFDSSLGNISGNVLIYATWYSLVPFGFDGTHVTAISTTDPAVNRVGTVAPGGQYTIRGLPPGDYYVLAEVPDLPGGASNWPYFPTLANAFGYASCIGYPNGYYNPDFYTGNGQPPYSGTNEYDYAYAHYCEDQPAAQAIPVTVTAGLANTVTGIDIVMPVSDLKGQYSCCNIPTCTSRELAVPLLVSPGGSHVTPSSRGVLVTVAGSSSVQLDMTFRHASAGDPVDIVIGTKLGNVIVGGASQILEQIDAATAVTIHNAATISSTYKATYTFDPFSRLGLPSGSRATIFVQAIAPKPPLVNRNDQVSNVIVVNRPW